MREIDPLEQQQLREAGRGHLTRDGSASILNAIERAREAQEQHEQKHDVQLRLNEIVEGDEVLVFDPSIWGGKDRGRNEHCWKEATIIEISSWREGTATVRFHHDGRLSYGHFLNAMRPLTNSPTHDRVNEIDPTEGSQ